MVEAKKKSSGGGALKWVIGCLVALVAIAILCAGGMYFLGGYVVDRVSEFALDQVTEKLEEAGIPQDEVDDIRHHLGRLKDGAFEGDVEGNDVERVAKEFSEGPLLPMGISFGFESYALQNPGLSAEEREAAVANVHRFRKGLWERVIDPHAALEVFEATQVGNETVRGNWEEVDQVREMNEEIRLLVEAANVEPGEFDFDVSDEVGRMVDELLGR